MTDDELRHIGATAHNCWLGADDEVDAGRRFVAECNFVVAPGSPVRADREALGRIVRETWVAYCIEAGDTKPSHIAPWEELSECDKEADRRIGEALRATPGPDREALVNGIQHAIEQLDRIAAFIDLPERQMSVLAIREVANSLRVLSAMHATPEPERAE